MDILFKLRSDFYPLGSRGKDLDMFQKLVEGDLTRLARSGQDCHNTKYSSNLSSLEKHALKSLML